MKSSSNIGLFKNIDSHKIMPCGSLIENASNNDNINDESIHYINYGKLKFNILPIYLDKNKNAIATLKFPCKINDLCQNFVSPLANVKLKYKGIKKKKKADIIQFESRNSFDKIENISKETGEKNDLNNSFEEFSKLNILNKYCRNKKYPEINIDRFQVPDDKVLFCVKYSDYKIDNVPFIDANSNEFIMNNNRVSYKKADDFILYKNPVGRTGIIGKGLFKHYGPNIFAFLVITKYKFNSIGKIIIDNNKNPLYQFLAIKYNNINSIASKNTEKYGKINHGCKSCNNSNNNKWAIPCGFYDEHSKDYYLCRLPFKYEKNSLLSESKAKYLYDLYQELFKNPKLVYKGYLDDYLNTDNAWIEAIVENYHHQNDTVKDKLNNALNDSEMNPDKIMFTWVDFNDKNIYLPHKFLLDLIQTKLVSQWTKKNNRIIN